MLIGVGQIGQNCDYVKTKKVRVVGILGGTQIFIQGF